MSTIYGIIVVLENMHHVLIVVYTRYVVRTAFDTMYCTQYILATILVVLDRNNNKITFNWN
jgi:hypothetical protein